MNHDTKHSLFGSLKELVGKRVVLFTGSHWFEGEVEGIGEEFVMLKPRNKSTSVFIIVLETITAMEVVNASTETE
ncbi:MAG TPA: hypothetical protein V6D20_01750 [Candidatus Obscuribacterales bacterium]